MDILPDDSDRYEPTPEDWAEYAQYREEQAWDAGYELNPPQPSDECCEAHNHQDPTTPCPDCEAEWDSTWALGEGPDADPSADWWYQDLLMQASHGTFDPHCGWRTEQ